MAVIYISLGTFKVCARKGVRENVVDKGKKRKRGKRWMAELKRNRRGKWKVRSILNVSMIMVKGGRRLRKGGR